MLLIVNVSIEHDEFRKFRFYLQNWALAPVDNENPGLVIDNCDMLPNKNKLIQNNSKHLWSNSWTSYFIM